MTMLNEFYDKGVNRAEYKTFLALLNPFAPHITEELWQQLGETGLLSVARWPTYDEAATKLAEIEIVLQINGKVRDKLTIPADTDRAGMQEIAMVVPRTQELTAGKTIVKVICVPKKLVNIVVKG